MVIPEDQEFLSERSDRSSILVHGRNSHENHPTSGQRKRLIVSGSVRSLEMCDTYPNAFYWNPAGTSLVGSVGAWCFIGVPSLGRSPELCRSDTIYHGAPPYVLGGKGKKADVRRW